VTSIATASPERISRGQVESNTVELMEKFDAPPAEGHPPADAGSVTRTASMLMVARPWM